MTVRAKFIVDEVTNRHIASVEHCLTVVTLKAAIGAGNEEWSKYTPQGEIKLTITNRAAAEKFKPGEYHILTFERVEQNAE